MSAGNATLPPIAAVIATVLILLVAVSIIIAVLLVSRHKGTHRLNIDFNTGDLDDSYSTFDRGTKQQIQLQSLNAPADLYDQIQLSPSTGQSEHVSKNESEDTDTFTSITPDCHHIQESDVTETNRESLDTGKYNSEDVTYAVINKRKEKEEAKVKNKHKVR